MNTSEAIMRVAAFVLGCTAIKMSLVALRGATDSFKKEKATRDKIIGVVIEFFIPAIAVVGVLLITASILKPSIR